MKRHLSLLAAAAVLASASPAGAAEVRLPIAQGVWVRTAEDCGRATNVFVYGAGRFGSVYFYGPGQSLGPADETEALTHVGRGQNGFTMVNEGPLEVIPRPNGQAQVRAFSPTQGVAWVETVKLCAPQALGPKLRGALGRFGVAR